MTTPQSGARCPHDSCGCAPAEAYGGFCSAYCMNADHDGPPQGACACDHAACNASQHQEPEGEGERTALGPWRRG